MAGLWWDWTRRHFGCSQLGASQTLSDDHGVEHTWSALVQKSAKPNEALKTFDFQAVQNPKNRRNTFGLHFSACSCDAAAGQMASLGFAILPLGCWHLPQGHSEVFESPCTIGDACPWCKSLYGRLSFEKRPLGQDDDLNILGSLKFQVWRVFKCENNMFF